MTERELTDAVLGALVEIAPGVDRASIRPDVSLRDQVDLDSMDLLNLAVSIHERIGVDIPESDYARLATLDSAVAYLRERLAARAR